MPILISWNRQPHVQIRVVKHIWHEIGVILWNIRVVDDVIKLLLKVRVVFKLLRPVFRIWLWSFLSQVFLLFEAKTYICIKFINTGLDSENLISYIGKILHIKYYILHQKILHVTYYIFIKKYYISHCRPTSEILHLISEMVRIWKGVVKGWDIRDN